MKTQQFPRVAQEGGAATIRFERQRSVAMAPRNSLSPKLRNRKLSQLRELQLLDNVNGVVGRVFQLRAAAALRRQIFKVRFSLGEKRGFQVSGDCAWTGDNHVLERRKDYAALRGLTTRCLWRTCGMLGGWRFRKPLAKLVSTKALLRTMPGLAPIDGNSKLG
jgi:hypothetical protein